MKVKLKAHQTNTITKVFEKNCFKIKYLLGKQTAVTIGHCSDSSLFINKYYLLYRALILFYLGTIKYRILEAQANRNMLLQMGLKINELSVTL